MTIKERFTARQELFKSRNPFILCKLLNCYEREYNKTGVCEKHFKEGYR